MLHRPLLAGFAALLLALAPPRAEAAIVSGNYTYSIPALGPLNPFVGSFTITFDNSAPIADTTVGLSNVVIPLVLDSGVVGYEYRFSLGSHSDVLIIGGTAGGVDTIANVDFFLVIANASTSAPIAVSMAYRLGPGIGGVNTADVTVGVDPRVTSVPEPASLTLLALGLVGLAELRRRAT